MQPEPAGFLHRLSQVRRTFLMEDFDCLLFFDMKNIRYLTGFTGSDGALVVGRSRTVLLVDGRYTTQAGKEATGADIFKYQDKLAGIAEVVMGTERVNSVGFEATAISFETYGKLREKLSDVELKPLPVEAACIRTIKDESEVARIREAARLASETLTAMRDFIKPGISERDIALKLEYGMRTKGAEGVSFNTIVASGENSALPHTSPSTKKLAKGNALVIDFGAIYDGYHSDETCTFFVGACSDRQKEVYARVKEAHDRALAAVKAGMLCCEIDRIARDCISESGFGCYFSHGTGHGVGLDIHEPPKIASLSEALLETGMVVTVEPGIYLPGLWGMRIEDTVLVKDDGCEILTTISKNLTILN